MAAHVKGVHTVKANGVEYTMFVGMSVLADLQAKHGQDVLNRLEPPEGAPESWMPDLSIVGDLFAGALERHHGDVVDRWLVDDIIAENADAFGALMSDSFPDAKPAKETGAKSGNVKKPTAKAA